MNIQKYDILNSIIKNGFSNQRELAESTKYSLGTVNHALHTLQQDGFIDNQINITSLAMKRIDESSPKRAIILAAGFGMRMIPINTSVPKGLLEIHGEPLIERQIIFLREIGIQEIYIIVGFMKEQYEYLIDDFDVTLIVNPDYTRTNNLHSLKLAEKFLDNAYIVPCDIWCRNNPFCRIELYSWYMVNDLIDDNSWVKVNRKKELVRVHQQNGGNSMIGIAYLTRDSAETVREHLSLLSSSKAYSHSFWEELLFTKDKMLVSARVVKSSDVFEINTYEDLRELDHESNQLKSAPISIIADTLNVENNSIVDISVLKKGMTNRSFLFSCNEKKYIMRIPGIGTEQLINRSQECEVYNTISGKGLCDDVIYINPENGYRIVNYLENVRTCNSHNWRDVRICMNLLREFHKMNLKVSHTFDIFEQIIFYESLWTGNQSIYKDYKETKKNVLSLKEYIDKHIQNHCLTHIDAVPDNFLFYKTADGQERLQLIDWEYAGMSDPHVDIAMFCIYSLYNRKQIDKLINIYFENSCQDEIRIKIYCYISVCGLLWSNWCEYKRMLGVEFGEYALRQYRYAKDFYKIVQIELQN